MAVQPICVCLDAGNAGVYKIFARQPETVADLRALAAELLFQADKAEEVQNRIAAREAA